MQETFERVVDRKDAILRSLAQDIQEAEEQYPHNHIHIYILHVCGDRSRVLYCTIRHQLSLRSHLQNVDDLIGMSLTCF